MEVEWKGRSFLKASCVEDLSGVSCTVSFVVFSSVQAAATASTSS